MRKIILSYVGNYREVILPEVPRIGEKVRSKGKDFNVYDVIHDTENQRVIVAITLLKKQ